MDEKWGGRHWRRMVSLVALMSGFFLLVIGFWPREEVRPPTGPSLEPTRMEALAFREELVDVSLLLDELPAAGQVRRWELMSSVVAVLDEAVVSSFPFREEKVFPVVDRAVGGTRPFTETLRREHRLIERRWAELSVLAAEPAPDVTEFRRLARELIGVLRAHLQLEETVVDPLFDRALSPPDVRA